MARIMENRGIPVSFVGLADCRLEWALEQASRKSYVHDFLIDMFAFMARELKVVDATDESELSQFTDDLGSTLSGVAADQRAGLALSWLDERKYIKSDISRQLLAQYVSILVRHIDLISTFKPAAVRAGMAYWRSSQSNAGGKAWGQYAQGGLQEYTVACSHYAMMSDPYVGEVSRTVDGILVDLEKDQS
jgi:thioesterase domain-containing protein